jgi:hypothetical protein
VNAIYRLLSTLSAALIIGGCSSHAYYAEAMRYMKETNSVLIEDGFCSDENDCLKKELAFWTAGGWKIGEHVGGGVSINVYRISSEKTANKIIARCRALHSQMQNVPVSVSIFSSAHGTSRVVLVREKIS